MSPVSSKLTLLALASTALAVPRGAGERYGYQREHQHHHHHSHHTGHVGTGTGSPYGVANATGVYPTGTAASTGFHVPSPMVYSSEVVAVDAAPADSYSPTSTDSVVHMTVTNRNTVYVTMSAASAVEAAAVESSTEASVSLTLSVAQKAYGANKWRSHRQSSTAAATSVAAATSTAVVAPVATSTSSTSTAAAAATSAAATSASSSSSSGKRGVAYNDASLCDLFEGSAEVTWGYNWGQSSSGLASSFNYVPLLWGTSSTFTNGWSAAAEAAISSGSTHLMSFNEPDLSSQSNISPEDAATAYMTYMQPFAGKAKLGSPAVTNGGGATGLDWLNAFLTACSECTIDFVPIHWYSGSDQAAYFKEQVANATAVAGGKPVWVTEFGCTDGADSDISAFLEEVMPWMDEQSYVERYSYFMVADGYLVDSATALSSYGSTYLSYTS